MIQVKPFEDTWSTGFIIEGHADYDIHGKDIICAAVSAIAQACWLGVRRYSGTHEVIKSGYMEVGINKTHDTHIHAIMGTFYHGIKGIAEQHPKHVQIKEGEIK